MGLGWTTDPLLSWPRWAPAGPGQLLPPESPGLSLQSAGAAHRCPARRAWRARRQQPPPRRHGRSLESQRQGPGRLPLW
eukprot:370820-Pyramimonas_sp.AAC.1